MLQNQDPSTGTLQADGGALPVDRSLATTASVLYDAILIADGAASVETLRANGEAVHYVAEAYKHAKPIGALGDGEQLIDLVSPRGGQPAPGIVTTDGAASEPFLEAFVQALATHRHFDRDTTATSA